MTSQVHQTPANPPRILLAKFDYAEFLVYLGRYRIQLQDETMLVGGTREPTVAPGPACRWCPVQPDCDEGTEYLESASEDSGDW